MGTFTYRVELAASENGPFEALDALVDTGALYSWMPRSLFERLGISATGTRAFQMANGEIINRDIAQPVVRIDGEIVHTICVFGDATDAVLLGAYTLEGLALAVDPGNKRLVRMPTIPAFAGAGRNFKGGNTWTLD